MKRILKILGLIFLVIILMVGAIAAYIQFAPNPTYASVEIPDLTVELTPKRVERGQSLVVSGCYGCHSNNGVLEGKNFDYADFGKFHTSNLTQHKTAGIANYTDGELYRLLRTGIRKDNYLNIVIMPKWVLASDEDIYSIIAFLRSDAKMVQPVDKIYPVRSTDFLEKALTKFVFKPEDYKKEYTTNPSLDEPVEYGKYIVQSEALCYHCHSGDMKTINANEPEKTENYMRGGFTFKMPEYEVVGPSLLIDDNSNVGKWTEEQFVKAVISGIRPDLPAYKFPMHPFNNLSEAEVKAIYAYLKEISK